MRFTFLGLFLIFSFGKLISQETKKDTLITDEIVVVKPYIPTVADAFKVKSNPTIETEDLFTKENVNYTIFSIPVASTFTPSKGKAQGVKRAPKERIFNNYISAGFGNYMSPLLNAFVNYGDLRYYNFGAFIDYKSSQGGIKDILLEDQFSSIKIDLYYKQFDRDFNWKINGGYNRFRTNYYGLPNSMEFSEDFINSIDEKQVYNAIYLGGNINFEDAIFSGATLEFSNFFDAYESSEIQVAFKPEIEFDIVSEKMKIDFLIDFLGGEFEQSYTANSKLPYSFLNLGLNPTVEILRDNLSIDIGAKLYYTFDLENSSNQFKAYPNITGSFNVVDDIFILVAGVTGDLKQNSYKEFINENPFLSPTLAIEQSDEQYNAFIGAKGMLASNIGYLLKASYGNTNNQALFVQNQTLTNGILPVDYAFQAGNSFGVVYDNISTINILGEMNFDISNEFTLAGGFDYRIYNTDMQEEAWNLPNIIANVSANYTNDHWFAGAKLFFRGETKDTVLNYTDTAENFTIVTNNAYVDLNFNGGYNFSNRLSVFAQINNAVSKSYERFYNYPVQSIQILAGFTYKFDL